MVLWRNEMERQGSVVWEVLFKIEIKIVEELEVSMISPLDSHRNEES